MAEAGHDVTMLSGGIFRHPVDLGDHLRPFGVVGSGRYRSGSRSLVMFNDRGVKVNFVCTMAHEDLVEATDVRTFVSHGQRLVRDFRPQLTVHMGAQRGVTEVVRLARNSSSRVLATAWEFGWETRQAFELAHQVVCSTKFLANHYQQRIGLKSVGFPPPTSSDSIAETGVRSTLLVTETIPVMGAPTLVALRDQGFTAPIRIEGRPADWNTTEVPKLPDIEIEVATTRRSDLWQGVKTALSISVEAGGAAGAEAVLNHVPLVADATGPNEESSGGFGRFLHTASENGAAWAEAVTDVWNHPIDEAEAETLALKLYAPEIQRSAYVRLLERTQQG